MASSDSPKHPTDAILHAFAAGEVDPAQRAALSAHLSTCAPCRASLDRIRAVRTVFEWMEPPPLDELSWRRVSHRVQSQLEADAYEGSVSDPERLGRSGWVVAGLLAAAAVAAFVWFAPRRVRSPSPVEPGARLHTITSGERPLEVTLDSGAHLRLAQDTRIRADEPADGRLALVLDVGEVDVELPWRPATPESVTVETPDVLALAGARDFSVGYRAREFFVAVREGEVRLEPKGEPPRVVRQGDRAVLRFQTALGGTSAGEPEAPASSQESAPRRQKSSKHPSSSERIEPTRTTTGSTKVGGGVVRTSREAETNVQVEAPPIDALAEAWRKASTAYYLDRDLPGAIRLAEQILRDDSAGAGARPEVALARELLCEAYIATRQPQPAIDACSVVLSREPSQERARELHYKLATIYRAQLNDCRRANEHYGRVIVFGRSSILDDEALLWRARCALDLGDHDAALRDISVLEQRAGSLARPGELIELRRRFSEAQTRSKGAQP